MQVLYYSPTTWSNTDFYRTTGVLPFINHPEIITRDISHYGQINEWDLKGADVLIVQRPGTPNGLNLICLAKKLGVKVVLDYDDDILNVDFFNPVFVQYQQQREIILKCIEFSDEVWVSTESIKKSFGRGIVIKNALNPALIGDCSDFNADSNRIVWRGGGSHQADIYEKADELVAMVNNHLELDFYFIGDRFTYLEQRCGDNYYAVEGMPITKYFQYLKELQPRSMIFPLCNTKLNQGKSNISMIEATWAGANFFGNKALAEFNLPFVNQLSNFPNDTGHAEAKKYVEENLLLSQINNKRIESLLSL